MQSGVPSAERVEMERLEMEGAGSRLGSAPENLGLTPNPITGGKLLPSLEEDDER